MLATTIQETRVYQDAKAEGRREGEQQERALVLRLLTLKVAELPSDLAAQVQALPLPQLEDLGMALLNFTSLTNLQAWLEQHNTGGTGAPEQSGGDG